VLVPKTHLDDVEAPADPLMLGLQFTSLDWSWKHRMGLRNKGVSPKLALRAQCVSA
jgi:hypothetical protein